MRAILFDCDGTLADSFDIICETMRRCFAVAGLPEPDRRATEGIIGLSLDLAIARLAPTVPETELPGLVELYRQEFQAARTDPSFAERLFPGVEPMLRRLGSRDDALLGLVTGKSRRGVASVLAAHDLNDLFAVARTADDCPSKPHPAMVLECCAVLGIDPREAVVVGDAVYDMRMARAASAQAIGVGWGAATPEALLQAGASRVARGVAELEAWLGDFLAGAEAPALLIQPI